VVEYQRPALGFRCVRNPVPEEGSPVAIPMAAKGR
jgi:hypothetical protein